jgi:hypothetical protein
VKGATTASSGSWCQGPGATTISAITAYHATIFTADGNYRDQGTSDPFLVLSGCANGGSESFTSSLTQPVQAQQGQNTNPGGQGQNNNH